MNPTPNPRYDAVLSGEAQACHGSAEWVAIQLYEAGFDVSHTHATFAKSTDPDAPRGATTLVATNPATGETFRIRSEGGGGGSYELMLQLCEMCGVTIDPDRRPLNEYRPGQS